MNTIDNSEEFKDQVASLSGVDNPIKLLMISLLQYEQELETQGTEYRYKEGMNELINNYLLRHKS